jgi:DNA modification methylase
MPDASIGSVVTDPPYGLSRDPDIEEVLRHWEAGTPYNHGGAGFMGKAWDSFVPNPDVWKEAYRVLKPGGYLLAFAGTRTVGLMATSIEIAGFTICGRLHYLYGSGFPKSLSVGKSLDKAAGAERKVVGPSPYNARRPNPPVSDRWAQAGHSTNITAPATDAAKQWEGWGTALKPAYEPIVVAYKPFEDGSAPDAHLSWAPFCYAAKASRREREEGMPTPEPGASVANNHPTVKPDAIMQWLVTLSGIQGPILDPYMGSGSTGKALGMVRPDTEFVGVELDPHYYEIAHARVRYGYGDSHRSPKASPKASSKGSSKKTSSKIDPVLQQQQEELYLSILGFK